MTKPEYSLDRSTRASTNERAASPGARMRRLYFFLASLWGFGTGAIALAAGARLAGVAFGPSRALVLVLAVSLPVALGGGFIAAEAYREARRRLR